MPLIEIAPELTRSNDLLERIAIALELLLLHAYGVRTAAMTKPVRDPHPDAKETVEYATDDQQAEELLRDLAGRFRRAKEQDDAEEAGELPSVL